MIFHCTVRMWQYIYWIIIDTCNLSLTIYLMKIFRIASLYNWRYKKLGSLSHVMVHPEYKKANAGFVFDYQLIDVQDFNGVGESEPNPFFYQNLGEAEYVVATFMYMRLLGYPAEKISILTTYNGQKHLIRDVIKQRCGRNQFIGTPHKVYLFYTLCHFICIFMKITAVLYWFISNFVLSILFELMFLALQCIRKHLIELIHVHVIHHCTTHWHLIKYS